MTFLTKREVADILRVSQSVVDSYIKSGNLLATKPGGRVLIDKSDLSAFLEAGRIVSGPVGSPGRLV
ncbi:excise, DNA binding domain, excisionase family [uncultured Caudovirales phage]|uniref:Excise, DNA binding domain, excisionase family n=1 Tax=uncultured Caudovirales phage TaxID=2100421 RepID=A0A6J5RTB4_9CAUD|nr:excise, DNA binding domain, excisionase family [uncultured Caudovirales phage]CAB4187732.1 excise, DNA binding domain, excisionase family [uncultured Caudovirales phage]CAB4200433.1 excise, DNA binding domain, excisionase family [uncultured Caudovirales phage]